FSSAASSRRSCHCRGTASRSRRWFSRPRKARPGRAAPPQTAKAPGGAAPPEQRPLRVTPCGPQALSKQETKQAVAAHGVRVPRSQLVTPGAAAQAAAAIGFPVVIKAAAAALEHKSEVGGVVLNVRSVAEATAAARRLSSLAPMLLI